MWSVVALIRAHGGSWLKYAKILKIYRAAQTDYQKRKWNEWVFRLFQRRGAYLLPAVFLTWTSSDACGRKTTTAHMRIFDFFSTHRKYSAFGHRCNYNFILPLTLSSKEVRHIGRIECKSSSVINELHGQDFLQAAGHVGISTKRKKNTVQEEFCFAKKDHA